METVTAEVQVEFFQFRLENVGAPRGEPMQSAVNDHYPLVRPEARPAEPRRAVPDWGEPAEVELTLDTGVVRLAALTADPHGPDVPAGAPGRYRLRAYRRPVGPPPQREASFAHGAEQWLLQLWPV